MTQNMAQTFSELYSSPKLRRVFSFLLKCSWRDEPWKPRDCVSSILTVSILCFISLCRHCFLCLNSRARQILMLFSPGVFHGTSLSVLTEDECCRLMLTLNGWGRSLEPRLSTTESVIPLAWSSWLQTCQRTADWPLTFDGPIKIWCNFWPEENTHYVREWRKLCPLISYYEDKEAIQ